MENEELSNTECYMNADQTQVEHFDGTGIPGSSPSSSYSPDRQLSIDSSSRPSFVLSVSSSGGDCQQPVLPTGDSGAVDVDSAVVGVSDEEALLGQDQQTQPHSGAGGAGLWLKGKLYGLYQATIKSLRDLKIFIK